MRIVFTTHGWEDYTHWLVADRMVRKRINRLIDDSLRDPLAGIGKPEQLRHVLPGAWSRRIDGEQRLVYLVQDRDMVVCRLATTTRGDGGFHVGGQRGAP